jgi:hypothetical protein
MIFLVLLPVYLIVVAVFIMFFMGAAMARRRYEKNIDD